MKKKPKDKRKKRITIIAISLILVSVILSFLVISLIESQPFCGDGKCGLTENWKTCRIDCPLPGGAIYETKCGDGICEFPETKTTCPLDCGSVSTIECGDGICEIPETRTSCPEDCNISAWVVDYKKEMVSAGIPNNYLYETKHFDYGSRNIQEIIYDIRSNSISAEDAVKRTANWVKAKKYGGNIEYTKYNNDCTTTSASKVIEREWGLCSTMSMANIAILRGMGIATRPMSGCATKLKFCQPLSIIPGIDLPILGGMGDGTETAGELHAWVEVWLPKEGWVISESTSGQIYKNPLCTKYNIAYTNPTIKNFCSLVGAGWDYIDSCRDESLFD